MNGDVFTEQDALRFLKLFKVWEFCLGAGNITADNVKARGRFMKIFMNQKEEESTPFYALLIMTHVLDNMFSSKGWTPVQIYAMREGDAMRYRVRIEKKSQPETKS